MPFAEVAAHWPVIANLLAGSLLGAWLGAGWATRLKSAGTIPDHCRAPGRSSPLLLLLGHGATNRDGPFEGSALIVVGVAAGFAIGVVASLLGVAGGELLIPTLVLLFGADIKLAGSLSLAVSLPTMIVGFTRYSRDSSFAVLGKNRSFVGVMAAGSLAGTFVGAQLLGMISDTLLVPFLSLILVISAAKVWRHG